MSNPEKIYLELEEVRVTSSRVVIGEATFFLRQISAVKVHSVLQRKQGFILCAGSQVIAVIVGLIFRLILDGGIFFAAFPALIGLAALGLRDMYWVQISTAGKASENTLGSKDRERAVEIVEAINEALLHVETPAAPAATTPETGVVAQPEQTKYTNADEIRKYKDLLDTGAITADEYELKKKELLGL
jgi:hypothetical protein